MPLLAQRWEFGGGGAGSIYGSQAIGGSVANATTGFANNFAISGVLGHNNHNYLGGEIRYTYGRNDLKVTAGGASATFAGDSHAIHYDVLLHFARREAKVRPFVAGGGGIKVYRGVGTEVVAQPLGNIALLTKTQELKPLISVGGGVKFRVSPHVNFRAEFRDYITPFPTKVIAPVGAAKIQGWVQNFVPLIGLTVTW